MTSVLSLPFPLLFCSLGSICISCLSAVEEVDDVEEPEDDEADVLEFEYSNCLMGSSPMGESPFVLLLGSMESGFSDICGDIP